MNFHDFFCSCMCVTIGLAYLVLFVVIIVAFVRKKENKDSTEFYGNLDNKELADTLDIIANEIYEDNVSMSRSSAVRVAAVRLRKIAQMEGTRK